MSDFILKMTQQAKLLNNDQLHISDVIFSKF